MTAGENNLILYIFSSKKVAKSSESSEETEDSGG